MPEPARKRNPQIEPDIRPNLHVIEGGGETTPERGKLEEVEDNSSAQDLGEQERRFGVIQGGGETTPDRANLTDASANIDNAKEKEAESGNWENKVGGAGARQTVGIKTFLKSKGPMGLILTLLLGGGFGLSVLFSPGIAIVQMKEILVGDLNDQLGAMSLRSDALLRGKLKELQVSGSICTSTVSLRCKFATMSKRQVAKFQKAGFVIEPTEADKAFGRTKPTAITFPAAADGTPGFRVTDPALLKAYLRNSPEARSQIRKAFNPKFSAFADAISAKVFARFKTDKSQKVTGTTEQEVEDSVTKATAGQAVGANAEGHYTDDDGRHFVYDASGNKIYESGAGAEPDKYNEIASHNKSVLAGVAEKAATAKPGAGAVKSVLTSGLKGVSVLGQADTACTVYNFGRALSAAAKVARALQLVQYAMVIFNVADRTKSGDVTTTETSFIGNNLMATDTNKTVVDERSVWSGSDPDNAEAQPHDNPYYGANAFDSPGYKTAAYNEAPILTSRDLQYMVGGGLAGTLSTVMDKIAAVLGGRDNIRGTCSVVQSWWARTVGIAAGIASAIGSFGVSTVVTIGASVAIGFAMPFLEAALADILTGTVVSGKTQGVDAGDAAFAGAGTLMGHMAMGHGMAPASKDDLKTYLATNDTVKADYIASETFEAQKTPFDIYNQYSFLGSAVRKINPTVMESTASLSGALTNIPSILSTAFTGLVPHASAYQNFNDERFSRCNDEAYRELGIDADVFCNVRYYMSPEQLAMDPDEAVQWMVSHGYIDENGDPKSDEYKDWIAYCTEREDGWGETSNDDPGDQVDKETGKICVDKTEENKYFGVLFMDKALNDSMDDDMSGSGDTGFFAEPDTTTASSQPPVHTAPVPTANTQQSSPPVVDSPVPSPPRVSRAVPSKQPDTAFRFYPNIMYIIS